MRAGLAITLCCALGGLLPAPALAAASCGPRLIDSAPLEFAGGHYLVRVRINGRDIGFIVDTGAQRTVVTSALVDRLDLPRDNSHWSINVGANGRGNADQDAIVSKLAIGKLEVSDLRAVIVGQDRMAQTFDGILGADILLKGDVQIDFPDRRISFYEPARCGTNATTWKPPYLSMPVKRSEDSGRILLRVVLDGHPLTAILDTGSTQSVAARDAILQSGVSQALLDGGRAGAQIDANGMRRPTQSVTFATVDIGRDGFKNVPVTVANSHFGEADMLVGLDYLHSRAVWLSADGGRMFVQQPSRATPSLRMSEAAGP